MSDPATSVAKPDGGVSGRLLDSAVANFGMDCGRLLRDSREIVTQGARVVTEATRPRARALAETGRRRAQRVADAAWSRIRQRPATATATSIAIVAAAAALASALIARRRSRSLAGRGPEGLPI